MPILFNWYDVLGTILKVFQLKYKHIFLLSNNPIALYEQFPNISKQKIEALILSCCWTGIVSRSFEILRNQELELTSTHIITINYYNPLKSDLIIIWDMVGQESESTHIFLSIIFYHISWLVHFLSIIYWMMMGHIDGNILCHQSPF